MNKKEEVINKIIDYSLYQNRKKSNEYIKFVSNNIERCEEEISELRMSKTIFCAKDVEGKIKELQHKIKQYYCDIEEELKFMS